MNGCNAQIQSDSLKLIATIQLPDVNGRIDHLAFDSKRQIIFVAALANNTIEIVDLKRKKVIHTIKNLGEPQGIVYIPKSNYLFVSNGDNGECDVFDAASFQKINSIKLPSYADNVRYDSISNKIYVGYGNGGIAIIDATSFKKIADIKLEGHPESFQIDRSANKIYVNVPDEKLIEVIDLDKNSVSDKWKMIEAKSNFPMSLDDINHRLFIGCRHPSKLLVLDIQTGKTVSSLDIDNDVDDIFYNPTSKQIYISCGGGYVDVVNQVDANNYTINGKVSSHSGARTSLFTTELNQLFVASPSGLSGKASILIYSAK